ncbi:MAG: response regulator [Desulfobacterales bacterium]|nr:response regulator [Desulfobacterales bacterium]
MGPRILIVDDDRDYLELSEAGWAHAGFKAVDALDDSRQAAELFESDIGFDVAVIDIGMPEMDGQALLEVIKKTASATIMVTAMNDARTAVSCLPERAYDYLVKPVSEGEVVFAVNRGALGWRLLDILHVEKSRQPHSPIRRLSSRSSPVRRGFCGCSRRPSCAPAAMSPYWLARPAPARNSGRAIRREPAPSNCCADQHGGAGEGRAFRCRILGPRRGVHRRRRAGGPHRHCNAGLIFGRDRELPLAMQGKLLRVLQDGRFTPVEYPAEGRRAFRGRNQRGSGSDDRRRAVPAGCSPSTASEEAGCICPPCPESAPKTSFCSSKHFLRYFAPAGQEYQVDGRPCAPCWGTPPGQRA